MGAEAFYAGRTRSGSQLGVVKALALLKVINLRFAKTLGNQMNILQSRYLALRMIPNVRNHRQKIGASLN